MVSLTIYTKLSTFSPQAVEVDGIFPEITQIDGPDNRIVLLLPSGIHKLNIK